MRESQTALEVTLSRRFKTKDVVERLGFISPSKIEIENYEAKPLTVFNPGAYLENGILRVYARTIFGYYKYVSSITLIEIPVEEVLDRSFIQKNFRAKLVVYPSNSYDMWGTEDPRVSRVGSSLAMVYAARTLAYFDPSVYKDKVLPLAALSRDGVSWEKRALFKLSPILCDAVHTDKDAFLADLGEAGIWLFHRPNLAPPILGSCSQFFEAIEKLESFRLLALAYSLERREGVFTLLASRVEIPRSFRVVEVSESRILMWIPRFEWKAGWGTPLFEIGSRKWLTILHGVDREKMVYRAFAAIVELEKGEPVITRVTPCYIMEPRDVHEIYGDRPFVVFPTGGAIVDNKLIIVYGAADSFIGIGAIDLDQLLSELQL